MTARNGDDVPDDTVTLTPTAVQRAMTADDTMDRTIQCRELAGFTKVD